MCKGLMSFLLSLHKLGEHAEAPRNRFAYGSNKSVVICGFSVCPWRRDLGQVLKDQWAPGDRPGPTCLVVARDHVVVRGPRTRRIP